MTTYFSYLDIEYLKKSLITECYKKTYKVFDMSSNSILKFLKKNTGVFKGLLEENTGYVFVLGSLRTNILPKELYENYNNNLFSTPSTHTLIYVGVFHDNDIFVDLSIEYFDIYYKKKWI